MKAVQLPDGRFAIEARYSSELVAAARCIPGMTFDKTYRQWVGGYDAVYLTLAILRQESMEVEGPPTQWFDEEVHDYLPNVRAYQVEGADYLISRKRAILGDVMRLGKTCTAITAAREVVDDEGGGRVLIVCPSYVRGVWQAELERWWPKATYVTLDGVSKKRIIGSAGGHIADNLNIARAAIAHYDILHSWTDEIAKWDPMIIILDEAHLLQSERSQRSQAARAVSKDASYVWALTGTPLTNRPKDLFNLADTVRPGIFGNFFSYGVRYCAGHKEEIATYPPKTVWNFSGKSNLEELNWRLGTFMLRRTVEDVGLELPAKQRQSVWVDVPAKARISFGASQTEIRRALDVSADAKLESVCALVKGHLDAGEKVIIFAYRRNVADYIADQMRTEGHAAEVVHGGTSHSNREHAILRAKDAGGPVAFVATIDAASVGIDLSFASLVVFAEILYEPAKLLQAEARPLKPGAPPVLIQYVLARGGVDELIASTVINKLDTLGKVVGETGGGLDGALKRSEEDVMAELYKAIEEQKEASTYGE